MRTCISCGTSIEHRGVSAKRCQHCAKVAIKESSAKWSKSNPEYGREYAREYARTQGATRVEYFRKRSYERYKANPDLSKARVAEIRTKARDGLLDSYVVGLLGLSLKKCPPELIEMKREALVIKRLSRQIKQTTKAQNETSTNIS